MPCPPPRETASLEIAPLEIAILLNSYHSPFIGAIRRSYVEAIGAVSPDSSLTFFYPAERDGELPDPERFDLVVVGGSNVDPRKNHPWIVRVRRFIATLVRDYPRKKICGICWGHQTICLVFGGEVADARVPELGVTEVQLTPSGRDFFSNLDSKRAVRIQQHHRRHVSVRPAGFEVLVEGNQCLVNSARTILTFQGHPEKDAETAKLRIADAQRWLGIDARDEPSAVCEVVRSMEAGHDGEAIWSRILSWASEDQVPRKRGETRGEARDDVRGW